MAGNIIPGLAIGRALEVIGEFFADRGNGDGGLARILRDGQLRQVIDHTVVGVVAFALREPVFCIGRVPVEIPAVHLLKMRFQRLAHLLRDFRMFASRLFLRDIRIQIEQLEVRAVPAKQLLVVRAAAHQRIKRGDHGMAPLRNDGQVLAQAGAAFQHAGCTHAVQGFSLHAQSGQLRKRRIPVGHIDQFGIRRTGFDFSRPERDARHSNAALE